jgi:hypothetical protein
MPPARPQRARRAAGRRRARPARRACADLAAGPERAAGIGGHRPGYRGTGRRAGHRTLVVTRKGGKVVTIPLAPRTARAIDLAIGERCEGSIFRAPGGRRLDRHGAGRIVRRVARRAGIAKPVGPHTLRHAFITAALDAGVPPRDVQEAASHADPRTAMRYDRARASLDGMPPTSSPPTSPARRDNPDQPAAAPPGQAKLARRTTGTLVRHGRLNGHVTTSNAYRQARTADRCGREVRRWPCVSRPEQDVRCGSPVLGPRLASASGPLEGHACP